MARNDLWNQCYDGKLPPERFTQMFCRVCRNPECKRSTTHQGRWVDRMMTQVERLLESPLYSDPNDQRFTHIRKLDFTDMLREAVRLEIVDKKGDWEPPSQQDVLKLAQEMITGARPTPPVPVEKPSMAIPVEGLDEEELSEAPEVLWEVRVRGTSGYYQVVLEKWQDDEPMWHCSCPAFKYRRDQGVLCKHIIAQKAVFEARRYDIEPEPELPPEPVRPPPVPAQRKPQVVGPEKQNFRPPMMNIPLPSQGVMVDGSTPPPPEAMPAPDDPWATKPTERVVAVGAKITMGGKKD